MTEVPAKPAFTIEKQQRIEGSGKGYTTTEMSGMLGQTVEYQIIVKNTGNVPLTFSAFEDEKCEGISGGPGASPIEPGESTTYTCEHVLTTTGPWSNNATDTGTPPTGEGSALTHTSNPVVTEVPAP